MIERLVRLVALWGRGARRSAGALDGFVDSLLQKFENCRPGLSDALEGREGETPEAFFTGLYEKEIPRLKEHDPPIEESLLDDRRAMPSSSGRSTT